AADDGSLLWEHRSHSTEQGMVVQVDRVGNAFVVGSSASGRWSEVNVNWFTLKYAASDGRLLWEKRYPRTVGEYYSLNTSRRLAVGPNGIVAVTGSSDGELVTVVYREGLAAVSIDKVPTGARLRFTGESGQTYLIERAPAVGGPWEIINRQIAPVDGLIEYHDMNPLKNQAF